MADLSKGPNRSGSGSSGTGTTTTTIPYKPTPLDPALGGNILTGRTIRQGGTAGSPNFQAALSDPQDSFILAALADRLGIDSTKDTGEPLVQQVTDRLAQKYGIKEKGGGAGGGLDSLRHDVASAVDAPADVLMGHMPTTGGGTPEPKASTKAPVQTDILQEVASKLGADGTKDPISAIAEKLGVHAGEAAAQPGTVENETAAENYANFVKTFATKNGTLTGYGQAQATKLEQAGFLDASKGNASPSANDVESAYKKLLEESVYTKLNPTDVLTNHTNLNKQEAQGGGSSEAEAYVQQEAASLGVGLTPAQITGLANQFTAQSGGNGLSSVSDQVRGAIAKLYDPTNTANPPGLANDIATQIQSVASDYQVPLSQGAIGELVKTALASGATSADDAVAQATQHIQQQAAGLYPALAGQIQSGTSTKTLVDPYFQVAQTYTGTPASTMQADDPTGKWTAFLQGGPKDPKSGAPTMMTLDQWKKTIMQSPTDAYGFQKSQAGQDMAEQLSSAILNELGRVTTSGSGNQGIGDSSYSGTPPSINGAG